MADISTARFLQAYGNFLVAAWGGPPLKNRFKKDPEKVLKEFGLDPEGAKVVIEPPGPPSPQATPESAAKLWNEGKKAGRIRFLFPEEPPQDLKTGVLSDKELEAVAGGVGNCCCCCTPAAAARQTGSSGPGRLPQKSLDCGPRSSIESEPFCLTPLKGVNDG